MHFFTSINNNYLPKARILAHSVKAHCNDARFSIVLSDAIPNQLDIASEPFDEVITIEELGIPVDNLNQWIFLHTVVELCTAVKGQALVHFLENGSTKVVYFDPDIVVYGNLESLDKLLDQHDFLLTPHQTIPDSTKQSVMDNEICSLKHGIYNFGFFAARNNDNGLKIARWWRDRLIDFCYDDIPNGLFTDQRWGDLIPAFFENYHIVKDPGCNVCTWNLTTREVTKEDGKILVNGSPLKFYHFSGFDSGAQEMMLRVNGKDNPILYEMRNWYIEMSDKQGQQEWKDIPSVYNFYDSGAVIEKDQRLVMRNRPDVYAYFADMNPFVVEQDRSFYKWYQADTQQSKQECAMDDLNTVHAEVAHREERIRELTAVLLDIRRSRSWRLISWYRRVRAKLGKGTAI